MNDDSGSSKNPRERIVIDESGLAPEPSPVSRYVYEIARDWNRYRDEFRRAAMARLRSHKWQRKAIDPDRMSKTTYLRHADGSEEKIITLDSAGYHFLRRMSDEERAEELASAVILLALDETLYRLRKALTPRLHPLEFAVGDDVAVYTGEHATVSVIAYSGANAFRHAKHWEALLGPDHKFDSDLLGRRRNEQAKKNVRVLETVYARAYPVTVGPCAEAVRALASVEWEIWNEWGDSRDPQDIDRYHARLLQRMLSVAQDACAQFGQDESDVARAIEDAEKEYRGFAIAISKARSWRYI